MLAIVNHEALIATKASRVCGSAQGDGVLEFGLRRAHGVESGLYGARAAIIGGCVGTSNVEAEYRYNTISKGTISHAFIMSFDEEIEAFRAYAKLNPLNVTVLADTYDTLRSGVPNAIKLFSELKDEGGLKGMYGIRLDSGDLSYLSKTARQMLDSAGFPGAKITASNDLDEYSILNLKNDGAKIDIWGVGTKMITAFDCPSLGGVYKLAQLEADGKVTPKMKISDDPFKITNPSYKKIVRLYLNSTHKATADLIMLDEEVLDTTKPIKIFHPYFSYKQRIVSDFYTKDLLECIFKDGELVYELPELEDIKAYHLSQKEQFWNEILRINGPEEYHVDISNKLYDIKTEFIHKHNFKE
jgi:nicotinate phosphoribosyltransferase